MNKIERVLLVDDDNIANFLNVRLLKKLNLTSEIKITNTGEEALDYLSNVSTSKTYPSLIFLDINMPIMNGIDFINIFKAKKHHSNRPVIIVLSSSSNVTDIESLKESEIISDFIVKPLTEEKVNIVVSKYFK